LQREHYAAAEEVETIVGFVVVEKDVDSRCAIVGNNHFLEQSPQNLAQTIDCPSVVEGARLLELWKQIAGPVDRTCHEQGEETYVGKEGNNVASGTDFFLKNINGVAQRLEGVEADAYGEDDVECHPIELDAGEGKHFGKVLGKEIVVFKDTENADVDDDIGAACQFLKQALSLVLFDSNTAEVTGECSEGNEQQKLPAPATVKVVAGQHDKQVLPFPFLKGKPVQQEYDGQKYEIF
jgi:hypothetical protein